MLLLYPGDYPESENESTIYIPLCFYFILAVHRLCRVKPHLHSTMLLLYPDKPAISIKHCIFTFHYASTLSEHPVPLSRNGYSFTFHYASTLSRRSQKICNDFVYLHSTMLLLYQKPETGTSGIYHVFTFHYASTLSVFALCFCCCQHHLHSTMLLLYQWTNFIAAGERKIYIPLCFYFIGTAVLAR